MYARYMLNLGEEEENDVGNCNLHGTGYAFPVAQDLVEIFRPQDCPQSGLREQSK